ncbi:unnamed protein product [Chrysodeixis includens]|uniref:RING finger protein 17 n=1 Tax=Chrysodeixis includens TaxID=689277 RepID=A0A9P0FQ91_CHRIL|nr:unnamed protein product [Chrysodeixis includens]
MSTMADDMKKYCPNCSQHYFIQFGSSNVKGNWPLFLPCGHTMCENCIINVIRCFEPLECKVCFVNAEITKTEAKEVVQDKLKLHKKFPINLHLVGELTINLVQASENKNKTEEKNHFLDLKSLTSHEVQANCAECRKTTTKICKQCAIALCATCFNKTHKNFVIFKNHELQPMESKILADNCEIHKEKKLEYYCKDCKKSICMDCMMVGGETSCKNHDVVPLQEINTTFLKDLSEISPQVDEIFRRLTKTAVDIGYLLHNFETDSGSANEISKTMALVDQHFSKLCAIVQKHKDEIMNIIKHLKYSEKDSLTKAKSDIANAIKSAKNVLDMISKTSENENMQQMNIPVLLEEAKKILDTPWYLNKKDTNKESLKVTVNEDLCALINDYVQLEGNVKSVYKLVPSSELGDVEIPAAPTAPVCPPELPKDARQSTTKQSEDKSGKSGKKAQPLYKSAPQYHSKSGSVSSLDSVGSDKSNKSQARNINYPRPIVHPVRPLMIKKERPQQLFEGGHEEVFISYIADPYNFFVQRLCFKELIDDIIQEYRNAASYSKPILSHVRPGMTYLAFNKAANFWQRCRVIGIDERDKKHPLIDVFYFDFGGTELVSLNNLRLLPPSKIQFPFPLAFKCSLGNCVPIADVWTPYDSRLMQEVTARCDTAIYIHRLIPLTNVDFKVECDVITCQHNNSLTDVLVYFERARKLNPSLVSPIMMEAKEKARQNIISKSSLNSDTWEKVTITQVVDPDKFFVRRTNVQGVFEKLSRRLEKEYNLPSHNKTIYLPEKGMGCAVNMTKFEAQSSVSWARGIVTEVTGRGRVRVLLADIGQELGLLATTIEHLPVKFLTPSALAIECHLVGIEPANKKWSRASIELLRRYEGKSLELKVEYNRNRKSRSRGSIGVSLYVKEGDNVVCINNEMVRNNLATPFGIYGFNKNLAKQQEATKKSQPQNTPAKPKDATKKAKSTKNDSELGEAEGKGPLRLEAKILHYESPSQIYISLLQQQKIFNELSEAIQKYYSKDRNQAKIDWKVGDRCCSLCTLSKTWRRAVILKLDKDTATLFYGDFACTETVPTANLKVLTPKFAATGDAALKCHLYGVMPALGEEWPLVTKECLKELLDSYKRIFITKLGLFKDNSMPIEIWVYHTVQGGALEPNSSEWRCLNNIIIERGLGIPDEAHVVKSEDKLDELDNTLSFLNIKGSVNEWLQLEPIPMVPLKSVAKETPEGTGSSNSPVPDEERDDGKSRTSESSESSIAMYVTDWLPPEPLTCKEFTAIPTYVDDDGVIYLHDVSQRDTLDVIRKALDVRFTEPDPKAPYTKWAVNEPCLALYYFDHRYYRGRVVEVHEEASNCVIHYIDYGNEELCSFEHLRKSVPLHEIPTQAHKCILNRIRPVGTRWDRQTLDYIHKSIVEKKCRVNVCGEPINGIYPIELKFDKLKINDHLVDFEMAEYSDGTKALTRKFAPSEDLTNTEDEDVTMQTDSGPDYIVVDETDNTAEQLSTTQSSFEHSLKGADWNKIIEQEEAVFEGNCLSYPKCLQAEFKCNISIINDINTFQLSIIFDKDTTKIYNQMFHKLQTESPNMAPLNGIFENKACVALFPEDGRWYRASILQFSETKNLLKVRYVDYGNTSVVSLADIREINEKWVILTPATVPAQLHGIRVNPEVDIAVVTKAYSKTFLDRGPFHVKVIRYNESNIPLVELKNRNGDLVYTKLIEKNILMKCE